MSSDNDTNDEGHRSRDVDEQHPGNQQQNKEQMQEEERRDMLVSTHDPSTTTGVTNNTRISSFGNENSSRLRQRLKQMHVPTTRDELREDVQELRNEMDHVAHGNRATFLPGIVASVPGVLLSYMIQPFHYLYHLTHRFHQRFVLSLSSSSSEPQGPPAPITSSWQRFRDRHRLHKQINRPPPMVAKGHYHLKGDPLFDQPDIFGE